MSPEVEAAIIAGSVGILTLVGTVVTQILGRRATRRDTEMTLNRTLAEQREQLDKTLAEQRTRTLNERFATAAGQLGSDQPTAVRLAGVYAMAGLADDWEENRQTCVDILCAYLRIPHQPHPGAENTAPELIAYRASREVRQTVIRIIAAHLQEGADRAWHGLNFDFTGVIFDGGDFAGAVFSGGMVKFDHAEFRDYVVFAGAKFCGAVVRFADAMFAGEINFNYASFSDGLVVFTSARFTSGRVSFRESEFSGAVHFGGTEFSGSKVCFEQAKFTGEVIFSSEFSGGEVSFRGARFSGGTIRFGGAVFSGGEIRFPRAEFTGTEMTFSNLLFPDGRVRTPPAKFAGTVIDFSNAAGWSHPPTLDGDGMPPVGVKLPKNA
jgi:uncharacterized protein YjbI with pentapeptide repeats